MSFLMQQQILELQQSVTLLQAQVLELMGAPVIVKIDTPRNKGGWPRGRKRKPQVKHEETPDNAA